MGKVAQLSVFPFFNFYFACSLAFFLNFVPEYKLLHNILIDYGAK